MAHGNFDCDTELCLTPGGRQSSNTGLKFDDGRSNAGDIAGGEQQQEITMLYGGQACVGDVTEIQMQARAIICMVRREMKEMMGSSSDSSSLAGSSWSAALPPPSFSEPLIANPGLSMKRSLQRFLQKRKARVYDSIPYQPQKKDSMY
ncbi:Protein TIFY 5A [Dendrobium catenatum]|uniref:Protein TIFY 5A n=1 Tax=Dendrobium catenatum TaxID=906689 RepID=A0A2I0X1T1_9ASPA|nr:Protein TIFY 5A [Dendrobium catenatum]